MQFIYRVHAVTRMFQREISNREVESVILTGTCIEQYDEDTPYPSALYMKQIGERYLHVVAAIDDENHHVVITAYEPNLEKWHKDRKTRKDN